jgi:non-canonical poly(A) RNA polymerase PAPD5/7
VGHLLLGTGRFAVDISLNQSNGLRAVRIVNKLLNQLPALQSLVMVVKLFLNQRSLNEVYTGGLGSYAIICMSVSFLQVRSFYCPILCCSFA